MATRVNTLYFISLIVLVLSSVWHYFGPFHIPDVLRGGVLPYRSVIVGVATRPDRLEQRTAVRKTWKNLINYGQSELYFFAAEKPCTIDPYWRLRESGCDPWNVFVPSNINERVSIRPYRVQPSLIQAGSPGDGIGFRLKFPISVTQLGLSKKALLQWVSKSKSNSLPRFDGRNRHIFPNLTVELLDPIKDDVLASADFSLVELESAQADDGFVYLPVKVTYEFRVEMTCEGCSGRVQKVLGKLEGIDNIKIDLEKKRVFVTTSLDKDQVLATLNKTGKETEFIGTNQ